MSFSQLRFDHYARELSLAVYDLSLEGRESTFLELKNDLRNAVQSKSSRQTMSDMSIEALKQRFMAIPGIENLTMRQEGGKQVFSLGGPFVDIGMDASEEELERALRTLVNTMPTVAKSIVPKPNGALTIVDPIGFERGSISSIFQAIRARHAAMIADIHANGAEVVAVLATGEEISRNLKATADAMKAEFHGLTNFPPNGDHT